MSDGSDYVKPGYQTTEFWLAMIVVVTAAAAALIQVYRGSLDASGACLLVASTLTSGAYSYGRGAAKS